MADSFLGAGFSLQTRQLLAAWFDPDSKRQCPDARNALTEVLLSDQLPSLLKAMMIPDKEHTGRLTLPDDLEAKLRVLAAQRFPCPHTEDHPRCRFPEIHELDALVDVYKATRPDPSDDDARREWLTRVDDWAQEGRELLHDHPDEVGANLLDLELQGKGWDGWTLRTRLHEVLNVMGDVIYKLYPPARLEGNPLNQSPARTALLGLVGDAVRIAERAGAGGNGLKEIVGLVLIEAGVFGRPRKKGQEKPPLSADAIRKLISAARRLAGD